MPLQPTQPSVFKLIPVNEIMKDRIDGVKGIHRRVNVESFLDSKCKVKKTQCYNGKENPCPDGLEEFLGNLVVIGVKLKSFEDEFIL